LNNLASRQLSDLKEIAKELGVSADKVEACCKDGANNVLIKLIESHAASFEQTAKRKLEKGRK